MIQKEKACPAVGAAEQASVGSILADGDSHNHCTQESTASQWKISDFLSTGRENALPLRYLVAVSGRDGRTVRQMIEKERRSGTPILSDCQSGYADAVMFLYRGDYYRGATTEQGFPSLVQLDVAKNRHGQTGSTEFNFWMSSSLFREVS